MNKFFGVGWLGGDPEPITNGCQLSLATTVWDGKQEKTIWLKVYVFGKASENCLNHKHKGDRILVEGRVDKSSTDKTIIVTDSVVFL